MYNIIFFLDSIMSKLYQIYLPMTSDQGFFIKVVDEENKSILEKAFPDLDIEESFVDNHRSFKTDQIVSNKHYDDYLSSKYSYNLRKEDEFLKLQLYHLSKSNYAYFSIEKIDQLIQLLELLYKKGILVESEYDKLILWNRTKKDFFLQLKGSTESEIVQLLTTHDIDFSFIESNIERVQIDTWVPSDETIFGKYITHIYSKTVDLFHNLYGIDVNDLGSTQHALTNQQKFVANFIQENSPYRGILLYHGLGSGKTGASISIAEGMRNRRFVIMLPASLKTNFSSDINRFGDVYCREHNLRWTNIDISKYIKNNIQKDILYHFLDIVGFPKEIIPQLIKKTNTKTGKSKFTTKYTIWLLKKISLPVEHVSYTEKDLKNIKHQLDTLYNYKYTFSHYNGGKTVIEKLMNKLIPEYKKITYQGEKLNLRKDTKAHYYEDLEKIMDCIFNPDIPLQNPFDNRVVIIDEVHNLISMIQGGGKIGTYLYQLLMRAQNMKIIGLSGTPVINYPFELSILFNLLRGYIDSTKIYLETRDGIKYNKDQLRQILSSLPQIDRLDVHSNYIEFTRYPHFYIKDTKLHKIKLTDGSTKDYFGITKSKSSNLFENNTISSQNFASHVLSILNHHKYRQAISTNIEYHNYTIFPDILKKIIDRHFFVKTQDDVEQIFNDKYILDLSIKNKYMFQKRILGLVSFYNEVVQDDSEENPRLFPEKIHEPDKPINVYLSDYQLLEYNKARRIERELEKISKRQKAVPELNMKSTQLFRVKSRQACLFVFPPDIKRPTTIKKKCIDELDELDACMSEEEEISYEQQLEEAIGKLTKNNLTDNDSPYNLKVLSPKYLAILNNINNSPGLSFCYSQFRAVEGIEIFTKILHFNGYDKYDFLKKEEYNTEENDILEIGHKVRYRESDNNWLTDEIIDIDRSGETVLYKLRSYPERTFTRSDICRARFALWTGTETKELRESIRAEFNKTENKFGKNIAILCTTSAGSEGINLENVRQVHILEPYWNRIRIDQVIGRARRINSHIHLPKDKQNVTVFEYKTIFSENQLMNRWGEGLSDIILKEKEENKDSDEEQDDDDDDTNSKYIQNTLRIISSEIREVDNRETSDSALYSIAQRKMNMMEGFLKSIQEAAIDCEYNKEDNIKSNPKLSENICMISETDTVDEYNYEVFEKQSLGGEKDKLSTDMKKISLYVNKPVILDNNIYIAKILKKEDLHTSDRNIELYNYYKYVGITQFIFPDKQFIPINTMEHVANLKSMKIEIINQEFLDSIEQYNIIFQIMNQLKIKNMLEEKTKLEAFRKMVHLQIKKKIGIEINTTIPNMMQKQPQPDASKEKKATPILKPRARASKPPVLKETPHVIAAKPKDKPAKSPSKDFPVSVSIPSEQSEPKKKKRLGGLLKKKNNL